MTMSAHPASHARACVPNPGLSFGKPFRCCHQCSEAEPRTKLKLAWRVGVGDLPKPSTTNAGSGILPIGPVEDVERVRLEHEARAFLGEPEGLAQGHIPVVVAR